MSPSSKGAGAPCKKCNKPTFAGTDGKLQHEKRANPQDYGGRRADPDAKGSRTGAKTDEAPNREHFLSKRLGGSKE